MQGSARPEWPEQILGEQRGQDPGCGSLQSCSSAPSHTQAWLTRGFLLPWTRGQQTVCKQESHGGRALGSIIP